MNMPKDCIIVREEDALRKLAFASMLMYKLDTVK